MRSIKPGRGPSMMGGFMSIFMGLFGVFWTILALNFGAGIMAPFGVIFIIIAIVQAVYNFKNATGKKRFSVYDVTESNEEPDPLNEHFGNSGQEETPKNLSADSNFCPYCGNEVSKEFEFCNKCGKKLP